MDIKNKKVILTGAGSGVGKELTKKLLNLGASVLGIDINKENLETFQNDLNNPNFKTYIMDVSKKEEIEKFKTWYLENIKKLDILINNAGIIQPFIKVEDLSDEIINKVMNVNFFGPLNLVRAFMDLLRKKEETYIVNVSSMGGYFPFPYQTIYGASKAALKIFTEGLYAELSNSNVKTMIVLPGGMETDITSNSGVKVNTSSNSSSYKMTTADDAAKQIIEAIKNNKFKIFIGQDAKFMKLLYKINSKKAIEFINKKMQGNVK